VSLFAERKQRHGMAVREEKKEKNQFGAKSK
jgi:hypothetical protein